MLDVKGNLYIDFDHVKYNRTLDRVMGQIIREAAREWLRAVLKSVPSRNGFPVLTGAAKSTLAPLGRILKIPVPVTPVSDGRHPFKDRRAEGEASQEFKIKDAPRSGRSTAGNYVYSFSWSNDILHYYINEFTGIIKSAPWHTLEAGEQAFSAYVSEAFQRRLPSLKGHIGFSIRSTHG